MHWSADFVGLSWTERGRSRDGVDCYGLICLVFRSKGIALASYAGDYLSLSERQEIAKLLAGGTSEHPWMPVVGQERDFDMIVFRRAGIDAHVGLVVERGRMLHISANSTSRIESFECGRWQPRLAGIYRHADLA